VLYRVWNAAIRPGVMSPKQTRRAFYHVASPEEGRMVIAQLGEKHKYEQFGAARDKFGLEVLSRGVWQEWRDAEGRDVRLRPQDSTHEKTACAGSVRCRQSADLETASLTNVKGGRNR